jgi:type II restriction/modification system DNA methylase subunit YeeA
VMKGGPFDIEPSIAHLMLAAPLNPNGRPNSDVIKLRLGGQDVVKRSREGWIIDFVEMDLPDAALYQLPFEYVREHVKPLRDKNRDPRMHAKWWLHGRSRPDLRRAISGLARCIVTPEVSKYRLFIWMNTDTVPDHTLHVIARDDDYFMGMVQSKPHLIWSLKIGSTLEDRPRYSSSRIFSTYPFPFPPGLEPKDDPRVRAIAEAAAELVKLRDAWLNPPGASEAELKKRTLTNLYNQRPTWLENAHRRLDEAVFAAYGWPADLSDDEILARLLALNLERAAGQSEVAKDREDEE